MIISVSRRTDIPAFYAKWFMNRIYDGYCNVPNPFNQKQISCISLQPKDVDIIVFWTRNPKPLLPYLEELNQRGYNYYFHFTIINNPVFLETNNPPLKTAIKVFQELADFIGYDKVIWRYDPIVLSNLTDVEFHLNNYEYIAKKLSNYTQRCVISILDSYSKSNKRLKLLEKEHNFHLFTFKNNEDKFDKLFGNIGKIAKDNKLEIFSCAEEIDLESYGIKHGKCIDDEYIEKVFYKDVIHKKDPSQREACGCVVSRDIGMYDTCLFGCQYCYATTNFDKSKENNKLHNPESPSLIEYYQTLKNDKLIQLTLF